MDDNQLQRIQALQFQDKPAAERLLLDFVHEVFPALDVIGVELRPLAVSLNSFNGFLTQAGGERLFFKTHVEPDSITKEYYNSQLLADAGYPIIRPKHVSTEYGKQFLIYDVIESPSVYDVARAIERGERDDLAALTEAQHNADKMLLEIYLKTLEWQSAEESAKAPVHQLFYHRLGERYKQFYTGKSFLLPGGIALSWEEICGRQWIINGIPHTGTLGEAVEKARKLLLPAQRTPSIIGHGDAHNGNVFYTPDGLTYFDPAFGGRHNPLLDLAKPLFHNVFATWMYHPQEIGAALQIDWHDNGHQIEIRHNYTLSPVRKMFLEQKIENTTKGIAAWYRVELGDPKLYTTWIQILKAALMCCPLLTMNLADRNRFSPEVGLLGLSYVVEMGLFTSIDSPNTIDLALESA